MDYEMNSISVIDADLEKSGPNLDAYLRSYGHFSKKRPKIDVNLANSMT